MAMAMTDEDAELHNALYLAATEMLMPYFEQGGGRRPRGRSEVESVQRACSLLDRVVSINPSNWNAFWVLGVARRSVGEYDQSYVALHEAYALQQETADVGRELSIACLIAGRDDEAMRISTEVAARNPADAGLVANLGLALFLGHRLDEAVEVVRRARRMCPGDPVTERLGAILDTVASGNVADAERMARSLVDASHSDPVSKRVLAAVRQAQAEVCAGNRIWKQARSLWGTWSTKIAMAMGRHRRSSRSEGNREAGVPPGDV